jgi:putative phosphoesterase
MFKVLLWLRVRNAGSGGFCYFCGMKKILLLSDTHSHIDDAILKYVRLADEVWHAGDIGDLAVTDALKKEKPLRAVYGNIDGEEARREFPLNNRFMCEGVDVWITHIGGYPGKYKPGILKEMEENPPKLFICGHSHILKVQFDKKHNLLHMNPGAAGKYGFHQVRTMLRFEIDGDKIQRLEVIELGKKN